MELTDHWRDLRLFKDPEINEFQLDDLRAKSRNAYFEWLCERVNLDDHNGNSYRILAFILHHHDFYWTNEMDENRAFDGCKLRNTWWVAEKETNPDYVYDCLAGPCTVLEMMIGLAERCDTDIMWSTEAGTRTEKWFWVMMENLGLDHFTDKDVDVDIYQTVHMIITTALDRAYDACGNGGFWPVKSSSRDQREVELWYQMCGYLAENYQSKYN